MARVSLSGMYDLPGRGTPARHSTFLAVACIALFTAHLVLPSMVAGQNLLPPRHGWTVEGAGALLDSTAVAGVSLLSIGSGPGWWISHATPYGVPGLAFSAASVAIWKRRTGGAVEWSQLSGDGLRYRSIHAAMALPVHLSTNTETETQVIVGLTSLSLGGSGARIRRWSRFRVGLVQVYRDTWYTAAEIRGTINESVNREFHQTRFGAAVACSDGPVTLRIGGSKMQRTPLEPSISVSWRREGVRFSAGAWGSPVAPAAGVNLNIGGITWCMEGRWVAGPGLYLLWSIRGSGGKEP
ncbi:hypothetical protein ACFL6T_07270 [Candidatus Zixiibacteriota bacterium]